MRKFTLVSTLVFWLAVRSAATAPQPVTFSSTIDINTFTGTWAASGLINDSGTLSEPTIFFVGNGELHITRVLTGEKGQITIRIQSKLIGETDDTATFVGHWVIVSGTGAYANLHGHGARAAIRSGNIVTETLTGEVHLQ
jgi:hypothetical protein